MQSKGAIKFVAILMALACIYQLSFTWATRRQEKKAVDYAAKIIEAEKLSANFAKINENQKAYYLDSLEKEKTRYYIDSISSEVVYLGQTYKDIKEKCVNNHERNSEEGFTKVYRRRRYSAMEIQSKNRKVQEKIIEIKEPK